jgi:diaminopropionate ammonia-lyase
MTALFRDRWGDAPVIAIVEPDRAPALIESIRAGRPAVTTGEASNMGRLDCKEPSHLALGALARGADHFLTITDDQAAAAVERLAGRDIDTTPSGAAGVAALQHADAHRYTLGLTPQSRILAFISEGREDA